MVGDDAIQARFLSVLSHDLRGALHTFQLSLEMLRRGLQTEPPDPAQMSEDLQLGQQALVEATVRLERLVTAERLRLGVMPVRPHTADLVAVIRTAIDQASHAVAAAAGEQAISEVALHAPPKWVIHTDPRLVGELIGALVDHALRRAPTARAAVAVEPVEAMLTISTAAPDWIRPIDEQMLQPASEITQLDPATVSLFVAGRCAELLHVELRVEPGPAQKVHARFPAGR